MSTLSEYAEKAKTIKNAINLSVGDPNLGIPFLAKMAKIGAVLRGKTHYTPTAGIKGLRELAAKDFRRSGITTATWENTVIGAGAKPLLSATIKVLLRMRVQKDVLIPAPYYPPYLKMVENNGGSVRIIDTLEDRFSLKVEKLRKKAIPGTNLIIINSPGNPTGMIWEVKGLETINGQTIFLFDEAYCQTDYRREGQKSPASKVVERAIVVRSFSKSFAMTGARVGYLTGPKEIVSGIENVLNDEYGCPCSDSQEAALVALSKSSHFFDTVRRKMIKRRDCLAEWLNSKSITYPFPQGAFYIFADFSRWGSSKEVTERLLSKRIIVTPGTAFGDYDGWIRISYASVSLNKLKEALKIMETL